MMTTVIKKTILLLLAAMTLSACCATHGPYNDPGAQRSRSQGAQDEMHRDTTGY